MKFKKIISVIQTLIIGRGTKRVPLLIKGSKYFRKKRLFLLQYLLLLYLERKYGVYIDVNTIIGEKLSTPHPVSIVIGSGVEIGNNVTIYQEVTLGGARVGDALSKNYPTIGNETVIFAGAKVIGNINVGNNCIIGANALVNKDIPNDHMAVGIPCKIIKKKSQ